jgi:hypothetical protein
MEVDAIAINKHKMMFEFSFARSVRIVILGQPFGMSEPEKK